MIVHVVVVTCLQSNAANTWIAFYFVQRFMAKHISELYEFVRSNTEDNQKGNWRDVEKRIKTQLPLRIVSCTQIASKLLSHYEVIFEKKTTFLSLFVTYIFTGTHFFYRQSRLTKQEGFSTPSEAITLRKVF